MMHKSTTSRCAQYAHPEVLVSYAGTGIVREDVSILLRNIEEMVKDGATFGPGETIQLGWLYGQFREHSPGLLSLYEPDLQAFPVAWVPGVTNILSINRFQLDVADSFGLREQAEFTTFCHSCLICSQFRAGIDFFMTRWLPDKADSGWFIGCLDDSHDHNDPDNLLCLSTYELATNVSRSPLMYLALPPDVAVEITNGLPQAGLSDKPLPIVPGSFVDALYQKATQSAGGKTESGI